MTRSPLFWFALGVLTPLAYHKFVAPLPGAKQG
jgi:hypothetical protein